MRFDLCTIGVSTKKHFWIGFFSINGHTFRRSLFYFEYFCGKVYITLFFIFIKGIK